LALQPSEEGREARRKVVAAREDLVNAVSIIAKKRGSTLYAFINDLLEQAVKADFMGTTVREIMESYEILKANKSAGQTLIPVDVLNYMASKLFEDPMSRSELEKMWRDYGRWYGEYLSIKFRENLNSGRNFEQFLEKIVRELRWELTEVAVHREGDSLRIRCVSVLLQPATATLLLRFLEGVMEALGYETKSSSVYRGIIDAVFAPKKP